MPEQYTHAELVDFVMDADYCIGSIAVHAARTNDQALKVLAEAAGSIITLLANELERRRMTQKESGNTAQEDT
jgi:hypothetical protein